MGAQKDLLQEETGNEVRHVVQPELEGDVAGGGAQGKQSSGWVICTYSQSSHVCTRHPKVFMFSSRHHVQSPFLSRLLSLFWFSRFISGLWAFNTGSLEHSDINPHLFPQATDRLIFFKLSFYNFSAPKLLIPNS